MTKRALTFLVGYILMIALYFLIAPSAGEAPVRLVSGYDITINGTLTHNAEITEAADLMETSVVRGDVITYAHLLPEIGQTDFPTLRFTTRACMTEVFINDDLVYTDGQELFLQGEEVPRTVHIVDAGLSYHDALMTIRLTAAEDGVFPYFDAPVFGSHDAVTRSLGAPVAGAYLAGSFLMLYGTVSLIAIMILYFRMRRFETQVPASMMAVFCGLFLLALIAFRERATVYLYWMLPMLYGYLMLLPKKMPKMMPKKVLYALAASGSALSIVFYLLERTHIVGTGTLVIPFLILMCLGMITPVVLSYEDYADDRMFSPSSMQLIGVVALALVALTGGIFYVADAGKGYALSTYLHYVVPVLAALFLTSQMFRYYTIISEAHSTHSENELLYRVAYEDPLTALYNRAGWDEKMKQLAETAESYCVISMDLDGLKAINDTQGHQAGDKLIKGFAKALSESFPGKYFLSRIGGDEFCVIMEGASEAEVKRCLERLEGRLAALDRKEKNINHRCSYGYAMKESDGQTAHELYLTADERMYAMKQTHKAAKKADAMTRADSTEVKVAQMVEETLAQMRGEEVASGEPATMSSTEALLAAAEASIIEPPKEAPKPPPKRTAAQAQAALRQPLMSEQKRRSQALQSIRQQEIARVSKENKVKKALKALEQAQGETKS